MDASLVKKLREETGAGIMDCKRALEEAQGDIEKAKEILHKKGFAKAMKKMSRETREGLIASYVHLGGRIGTLIEVNCETDFVARTDEFKNLVNELLLQITAMAPKYISKDDVPEEVVKQERERIERLIDEKLKGEERIKKIDEEMEKFYSEVCLMEQPYIKDESIKVKDLVTSVIAKVGENIRVRRFVRFELSE